VETSFSFDLQWRGFVVDEMRQEGERRAIQEVEESHCPGFLGGHVLERLVNQKKTPLQRADMCATARTPCCTENSEFKGKGRSEQQGTERPFRGQESWRQIYLAFKLLLIIQSMCYRTSAFDSLKSVTVSAATMPASCNLPTSE
jgi:hypothetical protein